MKKKFMFKAVSKAAKEFFDFDYRPNCLIANAAVLSITVSCRLTVIKV